MKKNKGTLKYLFSEDIQYVSTRKRQFQHKTMVAVILVTVLLMTFIIGSFVTIDRIFTDLFGRVEKPQNTIYLTYDDVSRDHPRTEVAFQSEDNMLTGYLYGSSKNAKGIVVISHGIGGGADSYLSEAVYFAKKGYRVLSFSNTGCHESEGQGTTGLSQSVIDLDAALDYVEAQEEFEEMPVFLYGHSWGGYAVTAILNYDHKVDGVVSVAGYNTPMEMIMEWCKPQMGGIVSYAEYPFIWIYQKLLFGGASNLSAVEGISSVDTPVLIIHGMNDEVIPYDSKASILSHRDEITNPNVTYLSIEAPDKSHHSNLWISRDAAMYAADKEMELELLRVEYGGESDIPEDVLKDWYETIDREKSSELDDAFMHDVYTFLRDAVK